MSASPSSSASATSSSASALGQRDRLLDEDVLAGPEGLSGELGVRRDRRRDHDRVERLVLEQILEALGQRGAREARRVASALLLAQVGEPGELRAGKVVEVSREVRPPVAEPGEPDLDRLPRHRGGIV